MFVASYAVTYCIYIPGKPGFCFHYYCAVYNGCKYSDMFWLADRVRLFVHYTISLSSLSKLIRGHWTYKMPVRYILLSLWVWLSIFSQLPIIQYMGLCVFILPISLVMIERIYTLSYYYHQIGSMNYYPLFRVRSWNNGMRCMALYILMDKSSCPFYVSDLITCPCRGFNTDWTGFDGRTWTIISSRCFMLTEFIKHVPDAVLL